jgi:hypothetical protein
MEQLKLKCSVSIPLQNKLWESLVNFFSGPSMPHKNTPKDIRAIVGLRFTFAVNININSYYSKQRILNVNSVLQAHGRGQQTDLKKKY